MFWNGPPLLLMLLLNTQPAGAVPGEVQTPPAQSISAPPESEAGKAAERQFQEGQNHYERGEYAEAIRSFSRAYDLFPAPILIFDMAQAHRLRGDCPAALREYQRFRKLAPQAPERDLTDSHIRALEAACPESPPPAPPPPPSKAMAPAAANPAAPASPLLGTTERRSSVPPPHGDAQLRARWVRFAALTAGLVAGTTATVLELRSRADYATWKAEDQALSGGPAGQDRVSLEAWAVRQQSNDHLGQSIRRRQTAAAVLGGVGFISLAGGLVLSVPYVFRW